LTRTEGGLSRKGKAEKVEGKKGLKGGRPCTGGECHSKRNPVREERGSKEMKKSEGASCRIAERERGFPSRVGD